MHASERGWWEIKEMKWGQVKHLNTNGVNKSNTRSSITHHVSPKRYSKGAYSRHGSAKTCSSNQTSQASTRTRGVQNRLTGVSVNRKSVNRFFGSRKIQTVTKPKISVNRFSVNRKFRFVQNPNRNRTEKVG